MLIHSPLLPNNFLFWEKPYVLPELKVQKNIYDLSKGGTGKTAYY